MTSLIQVEYHREVVSEGNQGDLNFVMSMGFWTSSFSVRDSTASKSFSW